MIDSKITLILKPGKKIKKVIDNIEYIFESRTHNSIDSIKVYDKTNEKEYDVTGSTVINLKIFEIKSISKFDSSRGSLHRSKDIELTIV